MSEESVAPLFDLDGAFNSLSLRLLRSASEAIIIDAIDRILAPYGGTGAYGRRSQISHSFFDGELTQLAAMASLSELSSDSEQGRGSGPIPR